MSAGARNPLLAATDRLERCSALDVAGAPLLKIVRGAISDSAVRAVVSGRWLGHALHPLLTDLPIGLWTSSLILDTVGGDSAEDAADLLLSLGLAAVGPTAVTGWSDWSETTVQQRRVGMIHAATNIASAGIFATSILRRRQGRRRSGKLLSLAGAGGMAVGAYLGGHLSYARAVGTGER
jgi:uncharacterized membrane protein